MALDTSRRNGRGGMLLTRRTSFGGRESVAAARRIEAEQWMRDHADELAAVDIDPVPDLPIVDTIDRDDDLELAWHEFARTCEDLDEIEAWEPWSDTSEDRLHHRALAEAADRARHAAVEAIEDRLHDPELPGWGTTFDPEDCQWGFTTHRSPHTLPGAVSGRPQPAHLTR